MGCANKIIDTWHSAQCSAVAQTMPCDNDLLCDEDGASQFIIPTLLSSLDDSIQQQHIFLESTSQNGPSQLIQQIVPSSYPMEGDAFGNNAPQYDAAAAVVPPPPPPPEPALGVQDFSIFTDDPVVLDEQPLTVGNKRALDSNDVFAGTQIQPRFGL